MADIIKLSNIGEENKSLTAAVAPQDMSLKSFQGGGIEVINLVRPSRIISPFSSFPWLFQSSQTQIHGKLSKKILQSQQIANLPDENFFLQSYYFLMPFGLYIRCEMESDLPTALGFDFYLTLPSCQGTVCTKVQSAYHLDGQPMAIENKWRKEGQKDLAIPLDEEIRVRFIPEEVEHRIILKTFAFEVHVICLATTKGQSFEMIRLRNQPFVIIRLLAGNQQLSLPKACLDMKLEIFYY